MDLLNLILPRVPVAHLMQWGIILSAVMPYLIACVQQRHWSAAVRGRVALGLCSVAAALLLWVEGALSPADWLASTTALFALTATLYRAFAKENGAASLESVTSGLWESMQPGHIGNGPLVLSVGQSNGSVATPTQTPPDSPPVANTIVANTAAANTAAAEDFS